jgi:hypothetical protein
MSQSSIFIKFVRIVQTLKYPIVLAMVDGVVWYIRSQPISVASHTVGKPVSVLAIEDLRVNQSIRKK